MTTPESPEGDRPRHDHVQPRWQPPPAGQYGPPPPPGQYGPPPGYVVQPAFDPVTGAPYSDKSKTAAGLLQLLLGFFLCIGGVGRLYAGHLALGVVQLVIGMAAWIMLICAFWLVVPIFTFIGAWLWFVVDGILLLAGRPVDGQGRLLRS